VFFNRGSNNPKNILQLSLTRELIAFHVLTPFVLGNINLLLIDALVLLLPVPT